MADANVTPTRLELISSLFSGALDRSPETRRAFLQEQCGNDAGLRQEVESLLAAHERSDAGWESPALGVNLAAKLDSESRSADPLARIGTSVGAYTITRLIAQGGMGAVYEAERTDDMRKRVAVKLLRRGAESELALRRFRHERLILSSLEHRNIAALLDGGVLEDGQPYFIMELVSGSPITDYCDRERMDVRGRVQLMRQVCRAVQHAHERLVVHRDLKPSNILVTDDGTVKLLDFGIAKLLAPEAIDGPVTQGHERAMTLEYASPEQVRGASVATASDVYALGVILFELLAGKRPFNLSGLALHEITRRICEEEAPALSTVAPVERSGALRGDLEAIVAMALRKEADRRYGSADKLSRDLQAYLDGRPVNAHRDSLAYRTRRFLRRHRWETAVSLLLVASLIGGTITTYRQARRAEERYREARRLANALVFDVYDAIRDLPGGTAARAALIKPALEYLDRAAEFVGADPGLDRELVFAYQRIGDVQGNPTNANLGDVPGAYTTYQKALSIARQLVASEPDSVASLEGLALVYERLADVAGPRGELAEGAKFQKSAIEIQRGILARTGSQDTRHQLAVALLKLGDITGHPAFQNLGDTAQSMVLYRQALGILGESSAEERATFRNRRYRAVLFERMGRIAQDGGDPSAPELLTSSLRLREQLAAERPASVDAQRDVAIGHFLLCGVFLQRRQFSEAEAACDRSLSIRATLFKADPSNAQLLRGMGIIYRRIGDVRAAKGQGSLAREAYRQSASFYGTLLSKNAGNASDASDAKAVGELARGVSVNGRS